MENILFLDSSGLSILISILKKVTAKEGATLQLCGLTKQPMELLELTQLHRVFTLIEECSSL
jgi:anti-anti-sigma factor